MARVTCHPLALSLGSPVFSPIDFLFLREAPLKLCPEDFGAGRTTELRKFTEEAERAYAADPATPPEDAQAHAIRGPALACVGKKD